MFNVSCLMRDNADSVYLQYQVVPDSAYLVALAEFHHALMLPRIYL